MCPNPAWTSPPLGGAHKMHPPCDPDTFSDAETTVFSPSPQTPTHSSSIVFIIKTFATGGTTKYRAHCDPNDTLAGLREKLHDDEDNIMSADDRFQQGDFRIAKSAEPHTKWRDILQVGAAGNSQPLEV